MSTPVVAGSAAIVRQYFEDGRYMLHNANVTMNPSAALVKACIIASARPLTAYAQNNQKFSSLVPSSRRIYEGYGLVNLLNVLPLDSSLNLFVQDRKPITQGIEHVYTLEYTPKQTNDFTVTLVWTDKPGASFSSRALVNDLDLYVEFINQESGAKVTIWGNAADDSTNIPDRLNNVERIHFDKTLVTTGHITIKVIGHLIPSGSQNYSLVISGSQFSADQVANSLVEREYNNIRDDPNKKEEGGAGQRILIPVWVLIILLPIIALLLVLVVVLSLVVLRGWRRGAVKYARMGGTEMKDQFIDEAQYYQ